jgi:serine/threonine-protein kinase HipA
MARSKEEPADVVEVHLAAPELGPLMQIGKLFQRRSRSHGTLSFAYAPQWLRSDLAFVLDPRLELYRGEQFAPGGSQTFGIFLDSAPDRWGRLLLDRREALAAGDKLRTVRALTEWDYLLGVSDESRMGALRFRREGTGPFLDDRPPAVPPATSLAELEAVSLALEREDADETAGYREWLAMLVAPGTSLGGSRPKANFRSADGSLWIAKFPSAADRRDVAAWEKLLHDMANACGITVPEYHAARFQGQYHTFCSKRFDRHAAARRFFVSAMTLLDRRDGEGGSYVEIAEFIHNNGARNHIETDLRQLYRRLVFNALVGNTDDHLRNHGFIREPSGWRLAPAFDLNPNPARRTHALRIDESTDVPDVSAILRTAPIYRLSKASAERTVVKLGSVTRGWKRRARAARIPSSEIASVEPAFSLMSAMAG